MLLIECALVLLAAVVAFAFPDAAMRLYSALGLAKLERSLARLARRRALSVIVVGLTALALRLAVLPVEPIPVPGVHDEFSYLLMSDTFSHGRLANPTHPMWIHFESFHINQKPTYASIYYPAQGLFLAFGQVFLHHPFWGVVLSSALMCAALCWMLQAWFPPLWALVGGLLAVIRLATFSYWVNSYFGGCVAALGGALVLGALPRIKRHHRWQDALPMGLGLALLANSRPYEGLFFSAPILIALLLWIARRPAQSLRRIVLPVAAVLSLTVVAMLYYFWRTTGSPFHTPYLINLATYNPVPFFPWPSIEPWPVYHHAIMQRFYTGWSLNMYETARHHPIVSAMIKAFMLWFFFIGPLFTIPILMLGLALPRGFSFKDIRPRTRFLLLIAAVTFFAILLPTFANPHYAAPLVCVIYALLLAALQTMRRWRWHGHPTGLALVRAVPILALALLFLRTAAPALHLQNGALPETWCSPWPQLWNRASVQADIDSRPGRHLMLVHYSPEHDTAASWVYNAADINNSKVVWANDMGPQQNQELIDYFKDRQVWLVDADTLPPRISAYVGRAPLPATPESQLFASQEHAHASH
jgi:hypothetical protein